MVDYSKGGKADRSIVSFTPSHKSELLLPHQDWTAASGRGPKLYRSRRDSQIGQYDDLPMYMKCDSLRNQLLSRNALLSQNAHTSSQMGPTSYMLQHSGSELSKLRSKLKQQNRQRDDMLRRYSYCDAGRILTDARRVKKRKGIIRMLEDEGVFDRPMLKRDYPKEWLPPRRQKEDSDDEPANK